MTSMPIARGTKWRRVRCRVHGQIYDLRAPYTNSKKRMDALETKLSEQIRLYRHLYDPSAKDHRDVLKAQNSWKEIAETMGKDETKCRKIWKNLRDRFVKNKKRFEKRSASAFTRPAPLLTELSWLSNFVKHRETESSSPSDTMLPCSPKRPATEETLSNSGALVEDTFDMSVACTKEASSPCRVSSPRPDTPVSPIATPLPATPLTSTSAMPLTSASSMYVSSPPKKRKRQTQAEQEAELKKLRDEKESLQNLLRDVLEQNRQLRQQPTPSDLYFQYMSRMMNDHIHPDLHMELQQEILQLMSDYRRKSASFQ